MASRYKGRDFSEAKCSASVYGGWHSHQCSRKPWKDGWCKQHHRDTEESRRQKSAERYEAQRKRDHAARHASCNRRIAELEARIAELEGGS